MAKKKLETDSEADIVIPPNYTDGDPAGKTCLIRVWNEGDVTLDYLHDRPKDREVAIHGAPFDHASTDPDGVWVYRQDRKN